MHHPPFPWARFQPPVVSLIRNGHLDRQSILLATLPEDSCWVGFLPPVDAHTHTQNFSRQRRECLLTATKAAQPQLPTLTRPVDDLLQFSSTWFILKLQDLLHRANKDKMDITWPSLFHGQCQLTKYVHNIASERVSLLLRLLCWFSCKFQFRLPV